MDLLPLRFAYLFPNLVLLVIFLAIFLARPEARGKMVRTGLWGGFFGPISQWWYLADYWKPEHTLAGTFGGVFEDVLFGFVIVGIMVGFVSIVTNSKSIARPGDQKESSRYWSVPIMVGVFTLLTKGLGLNSMHASPIAFLIFTGFIWWQRPDLIKYSLASGMVWPFATILGYTAILAFWPDFFARWWFWENISRVTVTRVPIEEILWFTTLGLFAGVAHEWRQGLRFVAV